MSNLRMAHQEHRFPRPSFRRFGEASGTGCVTCHKGSAIVSSRVIAFVMVFGAQDLQVLLSFLGLRY